MWLPKQNGERREGANKLTAVAIDKDKGSQNALKWAVDQLLSRGQTVILVHVNLKSSSATTPRSHAPQSDVNDVGNKQQLESQAKELFLPFRCFCTRKDIQCKEVILEDKDVAKALVEYVSQYAIENLVLGASSKNGFVRRFKAADVPSSVSKAAPDFCSVFVISKGKISFARNASRPAPTISPLHSQIQNQANIRPDPRDVHFSPNGSKAGRTTPETRNLHDEESFRSPFTRRGLNGKSYGELSIPETDISFVSCGRPSTDRMFPSLYEDSGRTPRLSNSSDLDRGSFESLHWGPDIINEFSSFSPDGGRMSLSANNMVRRRNPEQGILNTDNYQTTCKHTSV